MFDFTPVGGGVALAGVLFIALLGWRLLPSRKGQASREELFQVEDYVTELRVPEKSKMAGKTLRDLEATGGAETIAGALLALAAQRPPVATLALVLVGTMFLSDIINNAAAAVLMAPIAINVAAGLGVSADPFLMAVAIGASCAFLTPIGHQSNTLVMGPGGYRFGDYWRLGLPLEAVIVAVALPLLLQFWPLVAVK